jgi:hypothetical protein
MNDISLSSYASGAGWKPIGDSSLITQTFQGFFDGNGKKVSNLTINRPSENRIGLFGRVAGGTITNLGVIGYNITGNSYVGGLIGAALSQCAILNCYVSGNLSGNGYMGAFVGDIRSQSVIAYCHATGNVTGRNNGYIGDFAGYVEATISHCYATTHVTGAGRMTGGLAGGLGDGIITHCYVKGRVKGNTEVGGLIGWPNNYGRYRNNVVAHDTIASTGAGIGAMIGGGSGSGSNNYRLNTMVGSSSGGTSKTLVELQSQTFYSTASNWLNGNVWMGSPTSVWKINDGLGFPFLCWETSTCPANPFCGGYGLTVATAYEICTPADLKALADFVNTGNGNATAGMYYKLMNDIDLSGYASGSGWDPIGNNSVDSNTRRFQGNFDGNGKVIRNLTINRPTTNNIGLFGYIVSP